MNAWPVLVFGAPGALIGLLVCVFGALGSRPALLVIGGLLLLPSSLYLGAGFWPLLVLPLFPWLAALFARRLSRGQTLVCLLPNVVAVAWMVSITLGNLSKSPYE